MQIKIQTPISGLTSDSRKVRGGYLFAALPGTAMNGVHYIPQAIAQGASVILAPAGTPRPEYGDIEFITDANPRRAYAQACAAFYQKQPGHIVAVTGTNGKTSTVNFVQQLWQSLGVHGASLGTLGLKTPERFVGGAMTTPDPQLLHETLADLAEAGISHLAMEASSHGLDQARLDGVRLSAGAFTNLTQDHLDYHGNMDHYFKSKARLFAELLPPDSAAILNTHSGYFAQLQRIAEDRHLRVFGYGRAEGGLIRYAEPEVVPAGYRLSIDLAEEPFEMILPLVGRFQIENAMAALALVYAEECYDTSRLIECAQHLKPVRGRLEFVTGHPNGAGVYVDYAHTPDALENALLSLKDHCHGRLICVFGCGGDRDKTKRPLMAAAVEKHAQMSILTDDNPRTEDPASIRADALRGASHTKEIGDRREAIKYALHSAGHGDIVLIAGKGHEQGQDIQGVKYPFDDVSEVEQAMEIWR